MKYTYQKDFQEWLHFVRYEEIISVLDFLPDPPLKILEIGGGDGYIALLFSKNGYVITSTDIAPRYPASFPVQETSADHLEFPNCTFDVIFSSNVLEHIKNLPAVFKELQRVSKPNAKFIFVLPTPTWRIISSFWYILRLISIFFKKIYIKIFGGDGIVILDKENIDIKYELNNISFHEKIKRIVLHPHGEYPSFLHEMYYFSKYRWKSIFVNNGFNILKYKRGPLFYSGESFFNQSKTEFHGISRG